MKNAESREIVRPQQSKYSHISTTTQINIQQDYKTGNFTHKQLAKLYNISETTVRNYCKGTEKGSLKKEIEEIIAEKWRKRLINALIDKGINEEYLADKYKKLLDNDDYKIVLSAIQDLNKILDSYSKDNKDTTAASPLINLYLPEKDKPF